MSATTDSTPDLPIKQCTKCKETKPATREFFYGHKNTKDKLNSWCKSCSLAALRNWNETQPEEVKKSKQKWAVNHREQTNAKNARWWSAHPAKRQEYGKLWRAANPDKIRAKQARRRALKRRGVAPSHPFDEQVQLKRQHGKCYYCQCKLSEYHVEHVIPLSRGGSDHPDNKVLACPSCNLSKSNKLPHEWSKGGRLL